MDFIVAAFRDVFRQLAGEPDKERYLSVPWFATNICPPKRYQWAGYIGDCQGPSALAFGFNLEFRPEWQDARGRLSLPQLQEVLASLAEDELHWYGKPGFLYRNPPGLTLAPMPREQRVADADLELLLRELDDVLRNQRLWPDGRLMRPQLQVMRRVGDAVAGQDMDVVRERIREAMRQMQPLVQLMAIRGTRMR